MNTTGNLTHYEERLRRVTDYLHDHLDEELDLNRLAEVACLSPYHWHRIYFAVYGESIVATVKRLRLHRAAGYLAHTDLTVAEIAAKSGYKNVQSFTRIFKADYGLPPAQYRRQGSHQKFRLLESPEESAMYNVTQKTISAMKLATLEHTGSYMQIGKAFEKLYGILGTRNQIQPGMRMVGIYYDDPASVPEEKLRSRAGVVVDAVFTMAAPLIPVDIGPGNYAVLRHQGPYADMKAAYQWLYGEWLVQSGKEPAHAPVFEEYLNNPRDTAPTELLTDIYLPLL